MARRRPSRLLVHRLVAGAFIALYLAIATVTALTVPALAVRVVVDLLCLAVAAVVAYAELWPDRRAVRELRRVLDGLPETPHPLGH
jgi:hypothetical protein